MIDPKNTPSPKSDMAKKDPWLTRKSIAPKATPSNNANEANSTRRVLQPIKLSKKPRRRQPLIWLKTKHGLITNKCRQRWTPQSTSSNNPRKQRIRDPRPIIRKGRNSNHRSKNKNGIIMCMRRIIWNRDHKHTKRKQISIRLWILNETQLLNMWSYRSSYRVRNEPIKLFLQLCVIYGKE